MAPAKISTPKMATQPKAADPMLQRARRAAALLKHISDPNRLQMILILAGGERNVGALSEELAQSQPAVSHHLALLRFGGIVSPRREGKNNYYSLTAGGRRLASVAGRLTKSH